MHSARGQLYLYRRYVRGAFGTLTSSSTMTMRSRSGPRPSCARPWTSTLRMLFWQSSTQTISGTDAPAGVESSFQHHAYHKSQLKSHRFHPYRLAPALSLRLVKKDASAALSHIVRAAKIPMGINLRFATFWVERDHKAHVQDQGFAAGETSSTHWFHIWQGTTRLESATCP